ncbi:hypothetical protein [Serratia bockelmannii]|uniref:hypothetical protein n=1 Tax=Serratia TaxID=613 RepID=UPI0023610411|nr:hypothetical protein [Serratia bockelmannii]
MPWTTFDDAEWIEATPLESSVSVTKRRGLDFGPAAGEPGLPVADEVGQAHVLLHAGALFRFILLRFLFFIVENFSVFLMGF